MKHLLELKSNFTFLDKIEENIEPKNYKKFISLKTFLYEMENSIWRRNFNSFRINSRYLTESIIRFTYSQSHTNINNKDENISKISKLLCVHMDNRAESNLSHYNKKIKKNASHYSLIHIIHFLYDNEIINKSRLHDFLNTLSEIQSKLHLNDGEKIVDDLTGRIINGKYEPNDMELKFAVESIKFYYDLIHLIIFDLFKFEHFKMPNFNKKYYDEGRLALDSFEGKYEFMDLIGMDCKICKMGRLQFPDHESDEYNFPYGPVMFCDNEKCKSRVNPSLIIRLNKLDKESSTCPKCNDGMLKKTHTYDRESELFKNKKPIIKCHNCGFWK